MLNFGQSVFLRNSDKIRKTVIKIPSDTKYTRGVSSKVLESLKPYKIDESDIYDIRLCVEEAVINGITHGNRRDKRKSVKITYWIKDNQLNVEVEDEGSGFDYKHLSNPTTNDNIMKDYGRGVYLINNLMDEVKYNDAGNKIKMIKYLREGIICR